jgi:hypothetical protein
VTARGPFLVPVADGTPQQAADAMSDVLAAAWAARKGDIEGLAAALWHPAEPRGAFGMAAAVIAGIFDFGRVGDDTAQATLTAVARGCLAGAAAVAAHAGEPAPAAAQPPAPVLEPGRVIDAGRDSIALIRALLAGDAEGTHAILNGTSDPRVCMAALAALALTIMRRLGVDKAAIPAFLTALGRDLADGALDLFTIRPGGPADPSEAP